MSDVLARTANQQAQPLDDYHAWLHAWKQARTAGYETVVLTRHDNRLAVLLVHRNTGDLTSLSWEFDPDRMTPAPSTTGIHDVVSSEYRLAGEWPELGWNPPAAPSVQGTGVFTYPLGPVHADVTESLLYELSVMGDEIVHVYVNNGFKHRHIRQIVRGRTVAEAMPVISMFTTTSNVHHCLAMALAVEQAWHIDPDDDIQTTRTLMAELERVASHLGDLASLAVSTGLPVPQMEYLHLKEEVLRLNHGLFGHRYMRGSIVSGGLDTSRWPARVEVAECRRAIDRISQASEQIARDLAQTTSFLDRLHGAGAIPRTSIDAVRPVGPIGRSSGLLLDIRQARPYIAYNRYPVSIASALEADSYARFRVRIDELDVSLSLIRDILGRWNREHIMKSAAPSRAGVGIPDTHLGVGIVEAPRGMLGYWVQLDPDSGRIADLGIATPSERNWMVYAQAMANGNILQDFPIVDASFSLSVAGWDG